MKIFLGYGSEHLDAAKQVYNHLKTLVDDVWFDKVSLVGATDWDRERSIGQDSADMIIHLCSAEMLKRKGVVNREIRQTLRLIEDQPLGSHFALFIRLTNVRLPVELMRYQYIDFFASNWKEELSKAVLERQGQLEDKASKVAVENKVYSSSAQGNEQITVEEINDQYESRGSLIVYPESSVYWRYINAAIAQEVLDTHFSAGRFVPELSDSTMPEIKSDMSTTTEEFFRKGDILSIRFHHSAYYSGAAHGMFGVRSMNFLGPKFGQVPISYLLSNDEGNANKIMDYCENIILATYDGEISRSDLYLGSGNRGENIWDLISNYNIDSSGITINFNPYEILAYAFGTNEVLVPWRILDGKLSKEIADLPRWVAW